MIIRKPYAFLVHRFKLLHFLILIPIIYSCFMYYRLMNFFNNFVSAGYSTTLFEVTKNYFSFLMIIAALLVLIFMVLVGHLLKEKKFPNKLYVILTILYIIVLIYNFLLPGYLSSAELSSLASSSSLIIRGVVSILFFTQVISVIIVLLMMFGFNIKTGEFSNMKDEINLDEEDSQEIEINVKGDTYKAKRFFRRYSREFKYYIVENKNVFKIIGVIIILIILFFTIRFFVTKNKNIRIDQSFSYSSLSLSFNSSVLSSLNYAGKQINNDKVYLATKVSVINKTNGMHTIQTGDFCLEIAKDTCIYPSLDKSGLFIDIARPYYAEQIGANTSNEYVLVYELDNKDVRTNYTIKVLDSLTYKKDNVIAKYKEINLSPTYSDSVKDVGESSLNDEVNFTNTAMLNTKLKITNYDISSYYRYNYDYCIKGECTESLGSIPASYGNQLIILNTEFSMDENSSYFKNKLGSNDFFEDFGSIDYYIGENKYNVSVKNVTPKDVDDQVVLQVNSSIKYADKINLIITIRDKRFTIKLK